MPTDRAAPGPRAAAATRPDLVRLRRRLRAHPETGLHRPRSQAAVLEVLADLDLEVSQGIALSSVTTVVRGARPGPVVLLRAGLDDLSTAALAGAARILTERRVAAGSVVLQFPPGEEDGSDAGRVIGERVVKAAGGTPLVSYTLHGHSDDEARGIFHSRPGTVMGAADRFTATVRSRNGQSPRPVAAQIIMAFQAMTARRADPHDPVAITTPAVASDNQQEILSGRTALRGTVLTLSEANRARIRLEMAQLCRTTAQAHGMTVDLAFTDGRPMTVNDTEAFASVARAVGETLGPHRFETLTAPVFPAGDACQAPAGVPGCHVFVDAAATDDLVRADASLMLAELARRALEHPRKTG